MNRTSMVPACLVCLLITLTLTGQVFFMNTYIIHFISFHDICNHIYVYVKQIPFAHDNKQGRHGGGGM